MRLDTPPETDEVVSAAEEDFGPHVVLHNASGGWGVGIQRVGAVDAGEITAGVVRCMIDGLEYVLVELFRCGRVKWKTGGHEGIREALDANAKGTGVLCRSSGQISWIAVCVKETVQA